MSSALYDQTSNFLKETCIDGFLCQLCFTGALQSPSQRLVLMKIFKYHTHKCEASRLVQPLSYAGNSRHPDELFLTKVSVILGVQKWRGLCGDQSEGH